MADRSRGFRQGRTIPRRKTSWELGPGNCTETEQTGLGSAFVGDAITPNVDGLTLARIRGRLNVFLQAKGDQVGAGFCGAFGIGIATLAAVTAGAAFVPTPITEQAWDGWLYWQPLQLFSLSVTAGDLGANAGLSMLSLEVDTKAMRKMTIEDAIYAIVELEVEEGTGAGLETRFDSRSLFFLP